MTFDDIVHSMAVPENDKWTLMTGNAEEEEFGIFVKRLQTKRLAVKAVVGKHEMQIIPRDSNVVVTVNGTEVMNPAEGFVTPEDDMNTYNMR